MSRPFRKQSLSGAASATAGEVHATKSHTGFGLFVVASNLDTANDTLNIRLEAEGPPGEWAAIRDDSGSVVLSVSAADFEDIDGDATTWTAFTVFDDVPANRVRARITSFSDASTTADLSVDVYIMGNKNADGAGHNFET